MQIVLRVEGYLVLEISVDVLESLHFSAELVDGEDVGVHDCCRSVLLNGCQLLSEGEYLILLLSQQTECSLICDLQILQSLNRFIVDESPCPLHLRDLPCYLFKLQNVPRRVRNPAQRGYQLGQDLDQLVDHYLIIIFGCLIPSKPFQPLLSYHPDLLCLSIGLLKEICHHESLLKE